jgi:hypothetical protein
MAAKKPKMLAGGQISLQSSTKDLELRILEHIRLVNPEAESVREVPRWAKPAIGA